MKLCYFCAFVAAFFAGQLQAMEYELQYEDAMLSIAKLTLAPKEMVELHRDELLCIVTSPKGGVVTRIEEDGSCIDVQFPAGIPVLRPVNLALHKSFNPSDKELELIIITFKSAEKFLPL